MSKTRVHNLSLHKNKFRDETVGPYAALGGPFYIKKILGKSHYLIIASESFYHEVTPACFEQSVNRSTVLDTVQIKKNGSSLNSEQFFMPAARTEKVVFYFCLDFGQTLLGK